MENLNPEIHKQWIAPFEAGDVVRESENFRLAVNDDLAEGERIQILARPERTYVLVTPEIRDLPGVSDVANEVELRAALQEAGIALNGPDHLFFLDDATKRMLQRRKIRPTCAPSQRATAQRLRSSNPEFRKKTSTAPTLS